MRSCWRKNWNWFLLVLVVLVGFGLRFWNIHLLEFFTYDQARDAIYVKRIVADGKLRLLGTQTSLPGMYLPPFYYYTIAPVLWLFRLNPIGIDIYSATIGVLAIIFIFFMANQMFGKPAGIVSAAVYSVSPLNVELSRRAWNPSTLPFFIMLAFYFLWRAFKEKKKEYFLFSSIVYGYCLSLHFGAWTLAPIFFIAWIVFWKRKVGIKFLLASSAVIVFFISPLLLFELRHRFFLLSQAKIFFFGEQQLGFPGGSFPERFVTSIFAIFNILLSGRILIDGQAPLEFSGRLKDLFRFSQPISVVAQKPFSLSFQWWGVLLFGLIVGFSALSLFQGKEEEGKLSLKITWIWVLVGIFVSQFYAGKFFFFYYLFLFPVPFLLLGFLAKFFCFSRLGCFAVAIGTLAIYFFHLRHTTILEANWRDVNDLHNVARTITQDVPRDMLFNIASARKDPDRWDRNAVDYQYFVETFYDRRPLDWLPEDYEKAEILYLVSEAGKIDSLASPIMEVQKFNPERILATWELPKGMVIYKLGR